MTIHIALNRLFGVAEEINGHQRCPTYLYRWVIFTTRWFKVYVHHFVGNDWSRDLHDHPKRFISIGLWGRYFEQTPTSNRWYRAPWIRTFPAVHIHRIIQPHRCWTLVIVLKTVHEWGFWHHSDGRSRFIPWRDYVTGWASGIADKMKDCN